MFPENNSYGWIGPPDGSSRYPMPQQIAHAEQLHPYMTPTGPQVDWAGLARQWMQQKEMMDQWQQFQQVLPPSWDPSVPPPQPATQYTHIPPPPLLLPPAMSVHQPFSLPPPPPPPPLPPTPNSDMPADSSNQPDAQFSSQPLHSNAIDYLRPPPPPPAPSAANSCSWHVQPHQWTPVRGLAHIIPSPTLVSTVVSSMDMAMDRNNMLAATAAYSVEAMSERRRKRLPAWIREGLEKIEYDKQKKLYEAADSEIMVESNDLHVNKNEKSFAVTEQQSDESERMLNDDDDDDDDNKDDDDDNERTGNLGAEESHQGGLLPPDISPDVRVEIKLTILRKLITQLLMHVTEQEISKIANEHHAEMIAPRRHGDDDEDDNADGGMMIRSDIASQEGIRSIQVAPSAALASIANQGYMSSSDEDDSQKPSDKQSSLQSLTGDRNRMPSHESSRTSEEKAARDETKIRTSKSRRKEPLSHRDRRAEKKSRRNRSKTPKRKRRKSRDSSSSKRSSFSSPEKRRRTRKKAESSESAFSRSSSRTSSERRPSTKRKKTRSGKR